MYRLSIAGAVFAVGFALWFRPVLGLIFVHRHRGPPGSIRGILVRERAVRFAAVGCIVVSTATATLVLLS